MIYRLTSILFRRPLVLLMKRFRDSVRPELLIRGLGLIVILSLMRTVSGQSAPMLSGFGIHQKSMDAKFRSPDFRYVIVGNYFLHNGRLITVLIDPKALSETNLKEFFAILFISFP